MFGGQAQEKGLAARPSAGATGEDMITKDLWPYTTIFLRHDKTLRDHGGGAIGDVRVGRVGAGRRAGGG
jgi:hypothetical protein